MSTHARILKLHDYFALVAGPLQQYSVNEGKLSARPVNQSEELFGYPGSTPSISANGEYDGIVWVVGTEEPDTRTVIGAYFHRIERLDSKHLPQTGRIH